MKTLFNRSHLGLWTWLLLIWINISSFSCQEPPMLIAPYQKNYIVLLNDMVNLTCPYMESFFRWESDNIQTYLPHSVSTAKYLTFKAISTEASGVYNCIAINGFGRDMTKLYLKIIDPDSPKTKKDCIGAVPNEIPSRGICFLHHMVEEELIVEIEANQEVKLNCRALQTSGQLMYTWQMPLGVTLAESDDRSPLNDQAQISVFGKPGNSGRYRCQVRGSRGLLKRTFQVVIKAPNKNKIRLIKGPRFSNITVAFGGRAVIQCEAINPLRMRWGKIIDPQIKDFYGEEVLEWEKGNRVVMQGSTNEFRGSGTETVRQLVFDPVKSSDAGQYVCKAIGANVEDDKFVQLIVRSKPSNFVNRNIMVLYIGIPVVVIITCCILLYCLIKRRRNLGERQLNSLQHHQHLHDSSGPMQPMLSGGPGSGGVGGGNSSSGYHPSGNLAYMQQQQQQTPNTNSKPGLSGQPYKSQYMVDPYPMPPGSHPYASSDATSPSPLYYSGGVNGNGGGGQYPINGYSSHHYPT